MNDNNKKNNNTSGLAIGMCIGIAIGTAVGVVTKNIGLWLPIGLSIGVALGFAIGHNSDNNGDDETDGQVDAVIYTFSEEIEKNVIAHYDALIDEGNDPVTDPKPLKDYMDKWDGQTFIDKMQLTPEKSVLEIGVGTGRLALRVAPFCKEFTGIDISPKTIERAKEHLGGFVSIHLICADFSEYDFDSRFDVIYSSLTFMHFSEKQKAINKIYGLLNPGGKFVLSIDKNQDEFIDMDTRKLRIHPDKPEEIKTHLKLSGFENVEITETEFGYIFSAERK